MDKKLDRIRQHCTEYHELMNALENNRPEIKSDLRWYFTQLQQINDQRKTGNLTERIVKAMIHGLAEEEFSETDKNFCKTLLYLQPDESITHLLGGLEVAHKQIEGGEKRVKIIKRLLARKNFAKPKYLRYIMSLFKKPETSGHAVEVLTHPTFLKEKTLVKRMVHEAVYGLGAGEENKKTASEELLRRVIQKPQGRGELEGILRNKSVSIVFGRLMKQLDITEEHLTKIRKILKNK